MVKKVRKGVTAVVFRKPSDSKEPEFLLLRRVRRWSGWEMLKGSRKGRRSRLRPLRENLARR